MITTIKKAMSQGNNRSWLSRLFQPLAQSSGPPNPRLITEEADFYSPGGFHPVSLGDTFNSGTYKVMRKLGYGQYSTVWLARDFQAQRYVTLKILRADCYGGSHDIFEQEILSRLSDISGKTTHVGRHYVSPLLNQFKHEGPNGQHICLVFDVLGHHLDFQTARYEDGRLPLKAVKILARQLLLGLDFLHRECGVIHTDLKPTNILLELEDPQEKIEKYLSETPARMSTECGVTKPLREVIKTPLISEMNDPQIRIIDFGVASWTDNHLTELIQSPALRAPEVTIGAPWDTGVDLWSLGCLILEFVQGIVPFSGVASKKGSWTVDDDRLARTIETLGNFPPELLQRGERTAEFFNANGDLLRIPDLTPRSLEWVINGAEKPFTKHHEMPDVEIPIFIDFLRGMLVIDPTQRKSAAELQHHEWLKS